MSAPAIIPRAALQVAKVVVWEGYLVEGKIHTRRRVFAVDAHLDDGSELLLGMFDDLEKACRTACDAARSFDCSVRLRLQAGGQP